MGFVYQLSCPECGFQSDLVTIGLGAGCTLIHALAQDTVTGGIRRLCVTHSDVLKHSGRDRFQIDEEWVDALQSLIETMLTPTELHISPREALCPRFRKELTVHDRGIA